METWKLVDENHNYEVSDFGRVRRVTPGQGARAGHILKLNPDTNGYLRVGIFDHGKVKRAYVHLLVAGAFLGLCPEGFEVNHKDGVKSNPCLDNLEHKTHQGNMDHAVENGLTPKGIRNGCCKILPEQVVEIRALASSGIVQRRIAEKFGLSYQHVSDIVKGHRWGWLKGSSQLGRGETK